MAVTKLIRPTLILTLVLLAPAARGQDPDPEEEKAKRLAAATRSIQEALPDLKDPDTVVRGEALEAIAAVGLDLREIEVEGLAEKVRESGLGAQERFVAVLAGEILNLIDADGSIRVDWLILNDETARFERRAGGVFPRTRL